MRRFGSDRPDLRNPLELTDVTEEAKAIGFKPFEAAAMVKALAAPGGAALSRKEIDALDAEAKAQGAPGIGWAKVTEDGVSGAMGRFLKEEAGAALIAKAGAKPGDLLVLMGGAPKLVHKILDMARGHLGRRLELIDTSKSALLWVHRFPLVEWNEDEERWDAAHHPFTDLVPEDVPVLREIVAGGVENAPPEKVEALRTESYDLVIDGLEVIGGSLRIHKEELQSDVFRLIGIDDEQAEKRFGWFLKALRYGTPPHGGMAFGFDRLVMELVGEDSIREIIAFPKTTQAVCLMSEAPSEVDEEQLGELGLRRGE
jgi:aspartyl-tRNA synthetase